MQMSNDEGMCFCDNVVFIAEIGFLLTQILQCRTSSCSAGSSHCASIKLIFTLSKLFFM